MDESDWLIESRLNVGVTRAGLGEEKAEEKAMDLIEQQLLTKAEANDFTIQRLLGTGQHGMVVETKCNRIGLPDGKLYALKLLFNFTHEYTSVMSNHYENEWIILSRLLPHPNIVRYWGQFISPIPDAFVPLMPPDISAQVDRPPSQQHEVLRRKGQFIVLDMHPYTLESRLKGQDTFVPPAVLLKQAAQVLNAVQYLYSHHVCHLDLKLSNILVAADSTLVLCDFGCAVQFEDAKFLLNWHQGMSVGGNRTHLAPEVLSDYHRCRTGKARKIIKYDKQPSFAAGVLISEMATKNHPLPDYPLAYMNDGIVNYTSEDISSPPPSCPQQLTQCLRELLHPDPYTRRDIESALEIVTDLLQQHGGGEGHVSGTSSELERLRKDRDIAKVKVIPRW